MRKTQSAMIMFQLVLFTFFGLQTASNLTDLELSNLCVTQEDKWGCNCSSENRNTAATCKVVNLSYINKYINNPTLVERFDLSHNIFPDVYSGAFVNFTGLMYLSLSSCRVITIRNDAFRELKKLQELDLSNNNIQSWDTSLLSKNLPSLMALNVALNAHWMPEEGVLSIKRLAVVHVIMSKIPFLKHVFLNCSLVKKALSGEEKTAIDLRYAIPGFYLCISPKVVIKNSSFEEIAGNLGFRLRCNVIVLTTPALDVSSEQRNVDDDAWFEVLLDDPCWRIVNTIQILTLVIGILALFFNIAVVGTTLGSRALRTSVPHVLVANISLGDLLASFYIIVIIFTKHTISNAVNYYALLLPYYCRTIGLCFLVGQFSSIMMSFVMTLERYLAVIYCMRPHIRITMTTSQVAMVIVWSLAFSLAVSFMVSPKFSTRIDDMCMPGNNSDNLNVFALVALIGIILFASSSALYCHIYIDVKKTNEKTEQFQRECRLARRIAMVVFTNIIFFIVPMIATSLVSVSPLYKNIPTVDRDIFFKTFAVTCSGINCCLNPVLFSFRNERFRLEFSRLYFHRPNSVATET